MSDDAEIDEDNLGTHNIKVFANNAYEAKEKALDAFHDFVAIGVIDYVDIDVTNITRMEG